MTELEGPAGTGAATAEAARSEKRDGRRVAITAIGLCAPGIRGADDFWKVVMGQQAPSTQPDPITDDELIAQFPQLKPRYLDETAKYAILAAAEVLRMARLLPPAPEQPGIAGNDDIGMALGTLSGPIKWGFEHGFIEAIFEADNPQVSAVSSVVAYYGSLVGNVTIPLRLAGPSLIFCNLDVAGTDAIGYAYEAVRHGKSRMMIAGGADSPVTPMVETGIENAGVPVRGDVPTRLAPGAAVLLLEEWESARERGAPILGEVLGYETTTATNGQGVGRTILGRLGRGERPDCVMATGVAPHEPEILRAMFRDYDQVPPVTHVNWAAGYAAAASGGVQAVASVMLLGKRRIPPVNQDERERRGLRYVAPPGLEREVKTVLQFSAGLSRKTSMLLYAAA